VLKRPYLALPRSVAMLAAKVGQLATTVFLFLSLLLVCVGLWFLFMPAVRCARWSANLHRTAAGRWSTVEIPTPYEPAPKPLRPQPDGRYRHGATLYRGRRWPQFLDSVSWLNRDPATGRDMLWMITDPFVGLPLVALAPALVLGGLYTIILALTGSLAGLTSALPAVGGTPAGLVAGVLLIAGGALSAPTLLTLHARWTKVLLAPVSAKAAVAGQARSRWLRNRGYALLRPLLLLAQSIANLALALLAVLGLLGFDVLTAPLVLATRPLTDLHRRQAYRWSAVHIARPYRPEPPAPERREDGMYAYGRKLYRTAAIPTRRGRAHALVRDPATWRDLAFLLVSPVLSLLPMLATLLFLYGIFGVAWPLPWPYHWLWDISPLLAIPVGYLIALGGAALAVPLLRAHAAILRSLLGPTGKDLAAQRTRRLAETRTDATWAEHTELRRIERDLHDGAQARLAAIGMLLSNIEYLIGVDPAQAKELAATTRAASATALAELRSLVRSIHPPVLSERGLADALRALALDLPLTAHVTIELPGSLEAPLESAVYFATAELLSNALRHGDAREVWVDLRHEHDTLGLTVIDDGKGGADPDRGTGLRGIERRVAMFDGEVAVSSPLGGPTRAVIEIPCALQPPRSDE
jgi:signal transduction histidine kinase